MDMPDKLISMTDYVFFRSDDEKLLKHIDIVDAFKFAWSDIYTYAKLLKRPLELGMFVPCDLDGNVLEFKTQKDFGIYGVPYSQYPEELKDYENYVKKYQEALERTLFKQGFKVKKINNYYLVVLDRNSVWASWNKSKTLEDLIPLELTFKKQCTVQ